MTVPILTIPEDPAQWAGWLEGQLVGLRLGRLVDELRLITGGNSEQASRLEEICGAELPRVLRSGLSVLNHAQRCQLLKHPESLLELQERIIVEGGEYWRTVPISDEHQHQLNDNWDAIAKRLGHRGNAVQANHRPRDSAEISRFSGENRRSRYTFIRIAGTVAAAVLIGLLTWRYFAPRSDWGFDRPGALTVSLSPDQYLDHLATIVDKDWTPDRYSTASRLGRSLKEFRHGCDTLLAAELRQLSAEDRTWLRERCRNWRNKIDGHLSDLSSGRKSFEQVTEDANQTVRSLVRALQERA